MAVVPVDDGHLFMRVHLSGLRKCLLPNGDITQTNETRQLRKLGGGRQSTLSA